MSACKTTSVEAVYPELLFPTFPSPDTKTKPLDENLEVVTDNDTEIKYVLLDFDYYKRIVEYKLSIDEVKAKYNAFVNEIEK